MNCEHYSSFTRLMAVTSKVLKLKFCRITRPFPAESDMTKAEILWVLEAQKKLVQDSKFAQWKRQFDLFRDDHSIW